MGLQSQKRTKASKRRRASHFALRTVALFSCPGCGKKIRPHRVCPYCGSYKGRTVIKKGAKEKSQQKKGKTT